MLRTPGGSDRYIQFGAPTGETGPVGAQPGHTVPRLGCSSYSRLGCRAQMYNISRHPGTERAAGWSSRQGGPPLNGV